MRPDDSTAGAVKSVTYGKIIRMMGVPRALHAVGRQLAFPGR